MLTFRPCKPEDVSYAIPLMFSAGPDAYRYVFSIDNKDQALDFLVCAFKKGRGEFGYLCHQVAELDGEIVGLVGHRTHSDNGAFTWSAIKNIFSFYGLFSGLRVIFRGLKFEKIVAPPPAGRLCLHNLAVQESRRGQGIGQSIISQFIENAKESTYSHISLDVAITNPKAKALYRQMGFEVVAFKKGWLRSQYGKGVDHETMELAL